MAEVAAKNVGICNNKLLTNTEISIYHALIGFNHLLWLTANSFYFLSTFILPFSEYFTSPHSSDFNISFPLWLVTEDTVPYTKQMEANRSKIPHTCTFQSTSFHLCPHTMPSSFLPWMTCLSMLWSNINLCTCALDPFPCIFSRTCSSHYLLFYFFWVLLLYSIMTFIIKPWINLFN